MPSAWGPYPDEDAAIAAGYMLAGVLRPSWSNAARLMATAIGYAESRFGVTPDWQFPDGTPSYNWGAVVAVGNAGTISHGDHDKDGKPVTYKFAAFVRPQDGFEFWASRWPGQLPAQGGNARAVSKAMFDAHWFTGTKGTIDDRIEAYAKLIVGASQHVASRLLIPNTVTLGGAIAHTGGKKSGGAATAIFFLVVLAALGGRASHRWI